jgi:hypothetical protein
MFKKIKKKVLINEKSKFRIFRQITFTMPITEEAGIYLLIFTFSALKMPGSQIECDQ